MSQLTSKPTDSIADEREQMHAVYRHGGEQLRRGATGGLSGRRLPTRLRRPFTGDRLPAGGSRQVSSRPACTRMVERHGLCRSLPELPAVDSLHDPREASDRRRRSGRATAIAGRLEQDGDGAVGHPSELQLAICDNKKPRLGCDAQAGFCEKIRQHLLSHFWYYHRLRKLNYRVRNGNGCDLSDMVTGKNRRRALSAAADSIAVQVGIRMRRRVIDLKMVAGNWPISFLNDTRQVPYDLSPRALDKRGQAFVR